MRSLVKFTVHIPVSGRRGWFWAGAALILTTVKPHMVILVVPYLLLYMAYRRKWQGLLGFISACVLCMLVLFIFRLPWLTDFLGLFAIAPVNWATPTIGGLLSFIHLTEATRYIILLLIPLAWILARPQTTIRFETSVALLIILTVPTTFYGWSYDQSILLIPLACIFSWLLSSSNKWIHKAIIATMVGMLLINWT